MTGELSSLARTATSAVPIETDPWRILAVAESDGNTGIESSRAPLKCSKIMPRRNLRGFWGLGQSPSSPQRRRRFFENEVLAFHVLDRKLRRRPVSVSASRGVFTARSHRLRPPHHFQIEKAAFPQRQLVTRRPLRGLGVPNFDQNQGFREISAAPGAGPGSIRE